MPAIFQIPQIAEFDETQPIEERAAELRRLGDVLHAEADRLDGGLLTIQKAAQLAGRADETVRVWVRKHGIGAYDPVARRHMIRKSHLVSYVLQSQGVLPAGLRENLSAPKLDRA